jgi:hypothetical protein
VHWQSPLLASQRPDGLPGLPHHAPSRPSPPCSFPPPPQAPEDGTSSAPVPAVDLLGGDLLADEPPALAAAAPPPPPPAAPAAAPAAAGIDDLLGGMSLGGGAAAASSPMAAAAAAASQPTAAADPFDLLGGDLGPPSAAPTAAAALVAPELPLLLGADKGRGLTVRGAVERAAGAPVYSLSLHNGSGAPLDGFMLQLNSNALGLAPANQVVAVGTLPPGGSGSAAVPLTFNAAKLAAGPAAPRLQVGRRRAASAGRSRSLSAARRLPWCLSASVSWRLLSVLTGTAGPKSHPPPAPTHSRPRPRHLARRAQVALKTNQLGVFYWDDALPIAAATDEAGTIDGTAFLNAWRALAPEASQRLEATVSDIEAVKAKLGAARLFVLANRPVRARVDGVEPRGMAPGGAAPKTASSLCPARWMLSLH